MRPVHELGTFSSPPGHRAYCLRRDTVRMTDILYSRHEVRESQRRVGGKGIGVGQVSGKNFRIAKRRGSRDAVLWGQPMDDRPASHWSGSCTPGGLREWQQYNCCPNGRSNSGRLFTGRPYAIPTRQLTDPEPPALAEPVATRKKGPPAFADPPTGPNRATVVTRRPSLCPLHCKRSGLVSTERILAGPGRCPRSRAGGLCYFWLGPTAAL